MTIESWISHEIEHAYVADKRNIHRIELTLELLSQNNTSSITQSCKTTAQAKGAYRLIENPTINHQDILAGHSIATIERIQENKTILAIQDTTTLNYTTHVATEGLGQFSNAEKSRG